MSFILNQVRKSLFLDSVMLMQVSRSVAALPGVQEAALMMGTPANQQILNDSNLLGSEGKKAEGGDLIVAVRADDEASAATAIEQSALFLTSPVASSRTGEANNPRTLRSALQLNPKANIALISVPGDFASAEARKALRAGLHVMIFSDNVSLEEEIAIKREASDSNLLVMGPDCGTALIGGTPLGFCNRVPTGDIGIIGASGTGIQEVSCLIAKGGGGISHAIGVGGRDLSDEVGGISTLSAIQWLESDPKTRHIVLISKPPSTLVAEKIVERLRDTQKSATVCFFGAQDLELPAKIVGTRTLRATAANALGSKESIFGQFDIARKVTSDRKWIRGLFSGGSLAAEAQVIFLEQGFEVMSNAPIFAKNMFREGVPGHTLLDLGDDQYTRGRPHPMIDPAVRDEPFRKALDDNEVGVILLDIVIGFGSCADPASQVVQVLDKHQHHDPIVVASVTGTEDDPQVLSRQVAILESAGVSVAPSNAHAVETALVSISS